MIMQNTRKFYSTDFFDKQGKEAIDILSGYLEDILKPANDKPVLPGRDPDELVEKYENLLSTSTGFKEFLQTLINDSNHLHHPGYIGHQCAAPNPLTAISSLAGSLLNNGSAVYEMGPANVAMEKVVSKFFCREFSYPENSDGLFTSGGSLGNLTALLAARQNQTGYNIWEEGVKSDDQPVFMVPEASHYCIPRAVKVMGLGEKGILYIPVDEEFRMRTDLLAEIYKRATDDGKRVVALTANACSTATGSYDNLVQIGEFCLKNNIWFHIDGAHGGAAILSKKYRHLLQGAEMADSIVIDFHKMLMTPGLNTLILFRNGQTSWSTFAQKASYLLDGDTEQDWYNFAKRSMECTKSMMGLNVYIQLLLGGKPLFEENIDRLYDMGKDFAEICHKENKIELALEPEANIVCFRFNDGKKNLNMINSEIRKKLLQSGEYYIVQTNLRDKLFLRVSIMNPMTGKPELERLLKRVISLGEGLGSNPGRVQP